MKKINKILLIILLIIIIGCRPPTSGSTGKGDKYRTGTSGLEINFLPGAPPNKLYAEENSIEIPVSIEVRNKGAYPTPENRHNFWATDKDDDLIFISGFDANIIQNWKLEGDSSSGELTGGFPHIILYDRLETLEGKYMNNPEGGYDLFEFTGKADLSKIDTTYKPIFLVTACYDYETVASPNVCVDPKPFSTSNVEKVCNIQDIRLSSQGAPIAITKIEAQPMSKSIQYKIHFKNVGKGDVIATDELKKCSRKDKSGDLKRGDMDLVKVKLVQVGSDGITMNCGPLIKVGENPGYARLINGEGFIVCNYDTSHLTSAITTPMLIELLYGYRQTISKEVEIIKVPKPK